MNNQCTVDQHEDNMFQSDPSMYLYFNIVIYIYYIVFLDDIILFEYFIIFSWCKNKFTWQ